MTHKKFHVTMNAQTNPCSMGLFRVGNPEETQEVIVNQQRVLQWIRSEDDIKLKTIAGWNRYELPDGITEIGGIGSIVLPSGTRSIESILASYQTEETDEKKEALGFIALYQKRVHESFPGKFDASVTLRPVARTREGEMFAVPPHHLREIEGITTWAHTLSAASRVALSNSVNFTSVDEIIRPIEGIAN